ncbi:MAG TPA: hypothetical protein PLR76_11655 [Hyphomonas sp.]|nr:hypothetical protein [Hyphomonas sp.]MCA8905416.1 hypothetical protein [Hyphomonas sp.]MCB9962153.1 hypothetical protein [Hyphomonas sp.]HPE49049.1 hypothetical protein [Hyphomonas sp.]
MNRPLAIATLILGAVTLPACGLTGDLKRPEPLWGHPATDVEPAELPKQDGTALPKLPEREDTAGSDTGTDDELAGGPQE